MFPEEFPAELAALTFWKRQVGTCVDASPPSSCCLWASSLLWKAVISPRVCRTSFSGMPGHGVEAQPKEGLVRGCRKRQRCITCLNFRCEEKWERKKKEPPKPSSSLSYLGFQMVEACPLSIQWGWRDTWRSQLTGWTEAGLCLDASTWQRSWRRVFPDWLSSIPLEVKCL